MSPALLALAWAALILAAAAHRRPPPARVQALRSGGSRALLARSSVLNTPERAQSSRRSARRLTRFAEVVGARLLGRGGRPVAPGEARRLGAALLFGALFLPVLPLAGPPGALAVWAAPGVRARRVERRRLAALAADLPDVVDLLVLAVGAGLTVPLAVVSVARR
ncbi:MAG: hypothetical protein LC708_03490, partial [Actinobacteria bacterium]|nr:hypothetical protein [Actinomycetota bacterium]